MFVDLYRKTEEIRRQGEEERRLLVENLRVRSEKLEDRSRACAGAQERQEVDPALAARRRHLRAARSRPSRPCSSSDNVERLTGFRAERFTARPSSALAASIPEDRDRVLHELEPWPREEAGSYACEYRWRCADEITASSSIRA